MIGRFTDTFFPDEASTGHGCATSFVWMWNLGRPGIPYWEPAWYGPRNGVSVMDAALERAKLGPVKVRLLAQSPEVYATDIHEPKAHHEDHFEYACKRKPKETMGSNKGEVLSKHPWIGLNTNNKRVHVHLEDTKTKEVYWDADFDTTSMLFGKGRREVLPGASPRKPWIDGGKFRSICLQADDPDPHVFDLTIQGKDGVYPDGVTKWGPIQGMTRPDGKKAHIKIKVMRLPELEEITAGEPHISGGLYRKRYHGDGITVGRQFKQKLGPWTPGSPYGGHIRPDAFDRWLHGEQELTSPDRFGNAVDDRLYYDYTFDEKKLDKGYKKWMHPYSWENTPMEENWSQSPFALLGGWQNFL